jgi:hypothetical protein
VLLYGADAQLVPLGDLLVRQLLEPVSQEYLAGLLTQTTNTHDETIGPLAGKQSDLCTWIASDKNDVIDDNLFASSDLGAVRVDRKVECRAHKKCLRLGDNMFLLIGRQPNPCLLHKIIGVVRASAPAHQGSPDSEQGRLPIRGHLRSF